ncbi:hypothetical protein P40081_24485 [Paenibacillus sp. FSL P4-0081]|uniref:hypothetical protein n=1 Tax=Paenibacillus sp. FSL P4-0081 TaxID=1536769 RepID=UPI0004F78602|nr:hypothetical protein [Paenibacillus sp. FSL P4-0081]AIQ30973.1 hypothetical protein P40081_24485 [Paenibacillus sp. FSL P4-0081]
MSIEIYKVAYGVSRDFSVQIMSHKEIDSLVSESLNSKSISFNEPNPKPIAKPCEPFAHMKSTDLSPKDKSIKEPFAHLKTNH